MNLIELKPGLNSRQRIILNEEIKNNGGTSFYYTGNPFDPYYGFPYNRRKYIHVQTASNLTYKSLNKLIPNPLPALLCLVKKGG